MSVFVDRDKTERETWKTHHLLDEEAGGEYREYKSKLYVNIVIDSLTVEDPSVKTPFPAIPVVFNFTLPYRRRSRLTDFQICEWLKFKFEDSIKYDQEWLAVLYKHRGSEWFQKNNIDDPIEFPVFIVKEKGSGLKGIKPVIQSYAEKIANLEVMEPHRFKDVPLMGRRGKLEFLLQDVRSSETWRTAFVRLAGNGFLPLLFAYLAAKVQPEQYLNFDMNSFDMLMNRALVLAGLSTVIQLFRSSFYGYMNDTTIAKARAEAEIGEGWEHTQRYRKWKSMEFSARWISVQIPFVLIIDGVLAMTTGQSLFAGEHMLGKFLPVDAQGLHNLLKLFEFTMVAFLAQKSLDETITDFESIGLPKQKTASDQKLFRAKVSDYYSYVSVFANALTLMAMLAAEQSGVPLHWIAAGGVYLGGRSLHRRLQKRQDVQQAEKAYVIVESVVKGKPITNPCGLLFSRVL